MPVLFLLGVVFIPFYEFACTAFWSAVVVLKHQQAKGKKETELTLLLPSELDFFCRAFPKLP